jgi:LacI family transcriptional regulator
MSGYEKVRRPTVLLALGWYVHEIVMGVTRYAREAGWILYDAPSHSRATSPTGKCDGIITLLPSRRHREMIDYCLSAKLPVVDLSDQMPELPFPRVLPDNRAIGQMAAEHLLARGFLNFAFLVVDSLAPVVRERKAGFQAAVKEAGRKFHELDASVPAKDGEMSKVVAWLVPRLKKLPKPLAIMAQYDGEAVFILQACQEAGVRIPDEVAVIGVDNDPIYCELGLLPLSSVDSNREMQGYRAASLLDSLMKGGKAPLEPIRVQPTGVVVRKSTEVMAIADEQVARALRYINENFRQHIEVEDVVAASASSRRRLYNKFASEVGRSIAQELSRQRIAHAKRLLLKSGEKLDSIALESGFDGAEGLIKSFKYHEGISPTEFRERNRPS